MTCITEFDRPRTKVKGSQTCGGSGRLCGCWWSVCSCWCPVWLLEPCAEFFSVFGTFVYRSWLIQQEFVFFNWEICFFCFSYFFWKYMQFASFLCFLHIFLVFHVIIRFFEKKHSLSKLILTDLIFQPKTIKKTMFDARKSHLPELARACPSFARALPELARTCPNLPELARALPELF